MHWPTTCIMILVMDTLWQDIRLSLRRLRKAPLFAAVAVISISLGIGANTAVFSLLDQALLRSLPVKDPGRLVLLKADGPRSGWMNANYDGDVTFSYPVYRDFRDSKQFDGVLARAPITLAAPGTDKPIASLPKSFLEIISKCWARRPPSDAPCCRKTIARPARIPWLSWITATGRAASAPIPRC